jgi:hypothetical protein
MDNKCVSCEASGHDVQGFIHDEGELPLCDECREDYLLEKEMFYDEEDDY